MSRSTVAEINLEAVDHNWKVLTEIQSPQRLIPVIKANAYGHGAPGIAKRLAQQGAQTLAVALVEEAEELRESGYGGRILILGATEPQDIALLKKWNLTPVASSRDQIQALHEENFTGEIHIKWDTGMNRLGLREQDVGWLQGVCGQKLPWRLQAFCTHFLKSSDFGQEDGFCEEQWRRFQDLERHFPSVTEKHLFNTDSFFLNRATQQISLNYGARPGLSLYGYAGVDNEWTRRLRPVMTLRTRIVHLNFVKQGQTVSYNGSWKASQDSRIAVLPIGYADGYPRSLSNKGQVFIRGVRVPLVGMVCMDYIMVDVTALPSVEIGDEVELWGPHLPLGELAEKAGTIVYEMLASLTSRVPRRLKGERVIAVGTENCRLD